LLALGQIEHRTTGRDLAGQGSGRSSKSDRKSNPVRDFLKSRPLFWKFAASYLLRRRPCGAMQRGIECSNPLLSDRDVERITGRARSTLQKDRVSGSGIPFVRIGRLVRYRQAERSILPRCAAGLPLDQRERHPGRLSSDPAGIIMTALDALPASRAGWRGAMSCAAANRRRFPMRPTAARRKPMILPLGASEKPPKPAHRGSSTAGGGVGLQLGDLGSEMYLGGLDLDSCIADDGALALGPPRFSAPFRPTPNDRRPAAAQAVFLLDERGCRPFSTASGLRPDIWGTRRGVPGQDGRDHGPAKYRPAK